MLWAYSGLLLFDIYCHAHEINCIFRSLRLQTRCVTHPPTHLPYSVSQHHIFCVPYWCPLLAPHQAGVSYCEKHVWQRALFRDQYPHITCEDASKYMEREVSTARRLCISHPNFNAIQPLFAKPMSPFAECAFLYFLTHHFVLLRQRTTSEDKSRPTTAYLKNHTSSHVACCLGETFCAERSRTFQIFLVYPVTFLEIF